MATDRAIQSYLPTVSPDPEVLDFARREFDRGVAYYEAGIERLGLAGHRVLDAGCGVGNWSLGLRKFFPHVHALEYRKDRLDVLTGIVRHFDIGGVYPSLGTVERLPFEDETFDVVFCNGVISLTRYEKALSEFKRVLTKGGRLYVSFNSKGWWRHLIVDRGTADTVRFGCEAYLNRAFRVLDQAGPGHWHYLSCAVDLELERLALYEKALHAGERSGAGFSREGTLKGKELLRQDLQELGGRLRVLAAVWRRAAKGKENLGWLKAGLRLPRALVKLYDWRVKLDLLRSLRKEIEAHWGRQGDRRLELQLSELSGTSTVSLKPVGSLALYDLAQCLFYIRQFGTTTQRFRLWRDLVARAFLGVSDHVVESQVHAIEPAEMTRLLEERGFLEIGTSWEGSLLVDPAAPAVRPIYDCNQGVYETCGMRDPGFLTKGQKVSVEFFSCNARRAPTVYSLFRAQDSVLSSKRAFKSLDNGVTSLIRQAIKNLPHEEFASRLVAEIIRGAADREEGFLRLYRFIQDSLFHHPSVQLLEEDGTIVEDTAVILLAGIGRCGHTARVAANLFEVLGYKTRVTQLHKHVCAEVFDGECWRIVDADMWKAGVYPKDDGGRWLTLPDLEADPVRLDSLPAVGLMLCREGPWMRNWLGVACSGYVDAGLAWERPYPSCLYFGGELRRPPEPPELVAQLQPGYLEVTAPGTSPSTEKVRLFVDACSRGWSYLDYPDARFLNHPPGKLWCQEYSAREIRQGIRIPLQARQVFLNVCAIDEYMMKHPTVYAWPGDEVTVASQP